MMDSIRAQKLSKVIETLFSNKKSLKDLAIDSGYDPFSFYRSADLVGLDISGQDLTGLNFDFADIRFSDLSSCTFDKGAFNRSEVSADQSWLTDQYDLTANDLLNLDDTSLFIFAQFRAGFLDECLSLIESSYVNFSKFANVSANALRKSRKGMTVAYSTAKSILIPLSSIANTEQVGIIKPSTDQLYIKLNQPMACFMTGGINGAFRPVSRLRIADVLSHKLIIDDIRSSAWHDFEPYRETPESIANVREYYGLSEYPE